MTISIARRVGGPTIKSRRVNLKTNAAGCVNISGARQCTARFRLAGGNYAATISTMDASGNQLSFGQAIRFNVKNAALTTVTLNLNGIPHSLIVSPASYGIVGSQNGGFTVYSTSSQSLLVNALDADGNVIVGVGAPTYAMSIVSGTGWSVQATPDPERPNTFALRPPGTDGSHVVVAVSARAGGDICKKTGSVCHTSFTAVNHLQTLFVGGACPSSCTGEALAYVAPYTGTPTTVASNLGTITAMATDSLGNLFVASCNTSCGNGSNPDAITVYAPPYTGGVSETITDTISNPKAIALDNQHRLYVLNAVTPPCGFPGCYNVTIYDAPYTGHPAASTGNKPEVPTGMGVSPTGVLVVGSCDIPTCEDGGVTVWQPPAYSTGITLVGAPGSDHTSFSFDQAGDLFASDLEPFGAGAIYGYAPPFSPYQRALYGVRAPCYPAPIALDSAANLFVGGCTPSSASIYAPPYTAPPTQVSRSAIARLRSMTDPVPIALLLDGARNLFVINSDGSATITMPPYKSAPTAIASQLKSPSALAISP